MIAQLRNLWASRAPGERTVIAVLSAIVATALFAWLLQSAELARGRLQASLIELRAQAARLDLDAADAARLRELPVTPSPQADLRSLLQSRAAAAGIDRAIVRIEMPDADRAQVVFGAVSFADWLTWVAALQEQRVRLESGRIEAMATAGTVAVTATFSRARQP